MAIRNHAPSTVMLVLSLQACGSAPAAEATQMSAPQPASPTIVELRQYTMNPGQRDVLIELFEREFLETQEATGMMVFGEFRDLDRPDRFVWFRGFRDMPARAEALQAFYFGPVWKEHRAAANATIADSDNVLLLHPAAPGPGFVGLAARPALGAAVPAGLIVATIYPVAPGGDLAPAFASRVAPEIAAAGGEVVGTFATEHSPNNFPRLPVREGEHVFVSVERHADAAAYERARTSPRWRAIAAELAPQLTGAPEVLRLAPAPRSRLR